MIASDLPAALAAAAADYFHLVLLVGPPASGKTSRLRGFAEASGHSLVSIGGVLAARLLDVPERQRRLKAAELISDIIREAALDATVVLLDDIELLFAPSLALDPLRVLQSLARNRTIVATWPGELTDGVLAYADASHPEHCVCRNPKAVIVLAGETRAPLTA